MKTLKHMNKYNQIHLWIGTNFNDELEYQKYFELDYSTMGDFETSDYKLCQFCKDINEVWYDQDFIGIIPRFEKEVSLDDILLESSIIKEEWLRIKEICASLGILRANAIFWYADADLVIDKPYKENYNGLKYIGVYEGD